MFLLDTMDTKDKGVQQGIQWGQILFKNLTIFNIIRWVASSIGPDHASDVPNISFPFGYNGYKGQGRATRNTMGSNPFQNSDNLQ